MCRDGVRSSPWLSDRAAIAGAAMQPIATQGRSYILEDAQVSVGGDAQVPIEKAQLRRALINLLNNAVQHTAPHQVIQVRIIPGPQQVSIAVSNPGPAIADEHLPLLFERFYRVDAARSNSGGGNHGLGLAIVKAIALMHGGDVFVRSEAGANTFGIQLPTCRSGLVSRWGAKQPLVQ